MGISERKEKEKEIRRSDIIKSAEKLFFTKGYYMTTMDDIAKEAEFSKRTVYVYFNSKEQIYFEIMVRGYKILINIMEAYIHNEIKENALHKIKQIGEILYKFSDEYPHYFKAIMEYENGELDFVNGITDKSRDECYELGEKIFTYLTTILRSGIEERVIRQDLDIINTAIILWASTMGIFNTLNKKRNYIMQYHKREPEKLVVESFDILIRSIKI
jgi:AcrR family transcriptional regulator